MTDHRRTLTAAGAVSARVQATGLQALRDGSLHGVLELVGGGTTVSLAMTELAAPNATVRDMPLGVSWRSGQRLTVSMGPALPGRGRGHRGRIEVNGTGSSRVLRPGRKQPRRQRRLDELLGGRHRGRGHDHHLTTDGLHGQRPGTARGNLHHHHRLGHDRGQRPEHGAELQLVGGALITRRQRERSRLGPAAGTLPASLGGKRLGPSSGGTLTGYAGTIDVTAGGSGTDAVTVPTWVGVRQRRY